MSWGAGLSASMRSNILVGTLVVALAAASPAVALDKKETGTSSFILPEKMRYSFEDFPVTSIYKGPTRWPDFTGRDKEFRIYRTRIREGLKIGPNFAGEFTFITFGCGTSCVIAFIASNKTGQVFDFPRGGEGNSSLRLQFELGSRLIAAQRGSDELDACYVEYFEWVENETQLLAKNKIGPLTKCGAH
jgi:hypothetical protein